MSHRSRARKIASESLKRGDAVGWFEELYRTANENAAEVPWADLAVNPNLSDWLNERKIAGEGKTALIVGCGLGDDAEELARLGFDVTAFDVSKTAIAWCRRRFPGSTVNYQMADLFAPPEHWQAAFDFVLEVYTLQVLPEELHEPAARQIASFVAANGVLLVISRGREAHEDRGEMPWPLVRSDLDLFKQRGLREEKFEDYFDNEKPPVRRFRVEYRRVTQPPVEKVGQASCLPDL